LINIKLQEPKWGDPSTIDRRTAMNATLLTADRNTHIKIIAMGLSAAFMIALTALLAH
jgi:hypothetical protein